MTDAAEGEHPAQQLLSPSLNFWLKYLLVRDGANLTCGLSCDKFGPVHIASWPLKLIRVTFLGPSPVNPGGWPRAGMEARKRFCGRCGGHGYKWLAKVLFSKSVRKAKFKCFRIERAMPWFNTVQKSVSCWVREKSYTVTNVP